MKSMFFTLLMIISFSSHAQQQACNNEFDLCKGDQVINNNSIRIVRSVNNEGRVVLEEDSSFNISFTTADKVSRLVECHGLFCKGDEVFHGNSIRIVELVDKEGRVILEEDSSFTRTFTAVSFISMIKECDRHNER